MISDSDLQFMQPERLTDNDDGGGRMTGKTIISGLVNNLFDDVSEVDRTVGDVSARKCFAAVRTANTDKYLDSNVIISGRPTDPNISVTLFTTKSYVDTRSAAQNQLEKYLNRGAREAFWLYETQYAGQAAIQIWGRSEIELPSIDGVLCLVENRDKAGEYEQYIKIKRLIDNKVRTFTDDQGEFTRRVVTLELAEPLRNDFHGAAITRYDATADATSKAVVLRTVAANGARYYGSTELTRAASRGQMLINVKNVRNQLVPAARAETPIADVNAAGDSVVLVPSGDGLVSQSYNATLSPLVPLYLGGPCEPGTLRVAGSGYELTDRGGELVAGNVAIGTVNYPRGLVQVAPGGATYAGTKQYVFRPSAAPIRVADTVAIAITPETRGMTYVVTLPNNPAPGSVVISYRAGEKWYDLRDNAAGAAYGSDPSFGAANINYATGTLIITVGALPDLDSVVLVMFGDKVNYFNRVNYQPSAPAVEGSLGVPVDPGTLVVGWTDGVNDLVAMDDGTGHFTGDATGTIRHISGDYVLIPNKTPLAGTVFAMSGNVAGVGDQVVKTFNDPVRQPGGGIILQLEPGIQPGAVLSFNLALPPGTTSDAMKQYVGSPGTVEAVMQADGSFSGVNAQYNTASGVLTLHSEYATQIPVEKYKRGEPTLTTSSSSAIGGGARQVFDGWQYETVVCALPSDGSGYVTVRYRTAQAASAFTVDVTMSELVFDLTDRYAEQIVTGAVRFAFAGKNYIDNGGRLITDIDPTTGAGQSVGEINYASGRCVLRQWLPGQTNRVVLQSLLTQIGGQPVSEVTFRVPVSPLRPGSVSLSAVSLSGAPVRIDTNGDSEFTTETARGKIDYATGVVFVEFGRMVTAAGYEHEVWYDPDKVGADGKIWQPLPVLADTIRYSAVGYTYLSLDPEVLGLNPVRLPTDGRVEIIRNNDTLVVQHDDMYALPAAVSAGVPYNVGRTRLSKLWVVDNDNAGVELPVDRYVADLDTGDVVFNAPLDLSGTSGNLSIKHRIEDASVVYDVQLNGDLALQKPLSHNFPAGAVVSSVLHLGTLQARVTNMFTQASWLNNWLDYAEGAAISAQYNSTQYPVQVDNLSAINERFAIIFTGAQQFRLVGEYSGQIATGNINEDFAPINPNTGAPIMTIRSVGWGGGWSAGNVWRLDLIGAYAPLWVVRTVLQGDGDMDGDLVTLQLRGDSNKG